MPRYLILRLLFPLILGAALCFILATRYCEPWRSLLVNLSAALIGSIVTVFYVEAVLKRQQRLNRESVRLRTNDRLIKLCIAGLSTVRTALQIKLDDVIGLAVLRSGNSANINAEFVRLAESVLPQSMGRLSELRENGWRVLIASLTGLSSQCDQILSTLGGDCEPEITSLLLDIQTSALAAQSAYAILTRCSNAAEPARIRAIRLRPCP